MSFNPYASESSSRMKVKSEMSFEEQKAKREEDAKTVDNPLIEGKKLDMNQSELKTFAKAMEAPQFRDMLTDYVNEISDPKHKPEMQQYLRQMEEQGDLPPGTELIQPITGFCIKTTAKKMMSEKTKTFFDQKCFINVCFHEKVEKPQQETVTQPNGERGTHWSLPYRVSKMRHDQDNKEELCSTFDVVFHVDVIKFLVHDDFKKFVADTAIDGIRQVMAENKEKMSTDYKIMKNMLCKGGEPSLMTIKVSTGNPLLDNINVDKTKSKLEKDIMASKEKAQMEERKEEDLKRQKEAAEKFDRGEINEEESEDEDKMIEEKPSGIIQPKHKIVHSYPVDIGDSWGGYTTSQMDYEKMMKSKMPTDITITINVKWAENMKNSVLDINESTLLFEIPELYYLDLNLKYKCDPDAGSAKFDKTKKTLTIRMPVVGLLDTSQEVMDAHYKKWVVEEQARLEALEVMKEQEAETKASEGMTEQTEETEMDEEALAKHDEEIAGLRKAAAALQDKFSGAAGQATKQLNMGDVENIEDKYGFESTNVATGADDEDDQVEAPGILKVYQEQEQAEEEVDEVIDTGDIKYKAQDEADLPLNMPGGGRDGSKPLIQEIGSKANSAGKPLQPKESAPAPQPAFNWESAERVESKFTFINQGELVFVNFNFNGYSKESDVHYALSENEIFLEVRDAGKNKVHKCAKTLQEPIDCKESSVQLLVNYIVFKLQKKDKKKTWDQLGYDIQEFNIPEDNHYMRSNFLKQKSAEVGDKENQQPNVAKPEGDENEEKNPEIEKEYTQEGIIEKRVGPELSAEEKEKQLKEQEDAAIAKIVEKARTQMQMSCLSMSSNVFEIY